MISSRATCISRRKLSLLLLILLLPFAVVAAPYRVSVVSDDPRYSSLCLDVLSVLSGDVTSESAITAYEEKADRKELLEREAEISRLRQSESFDFLEELLSTDDEALEAEDETLTLEIVDSSFSDVELEFLYKGDKEATDYLMLRSDIDLLIAADATEDGMMTDVTVYANGDEIHRSLYISSEDDEEFESLLYTLLPMLKGPESVVLHIDVPSVVSVAVDGVPVSFVRSTLVVEEGEHTLTFSSPVYQTLEMTIDAENGLVISPELTEYEPSRLFVSTIPYDSDIYFQGLLSDSHFIEEADVPFQVTAVHPRFSPSLVQSRLPLDEINLTLRPEWMGNENIVERSKDRFYTNLLSTIISFGCYVASQSLSGIYPDADMAPVITLFAGVSFVQLVELFDSMFDYYQAASLGI